MAVYQSQSIESLSPYVLNYYVGACTGLLCMSPIYRSLSKLAFNNLLGGGWKRYYLGGLFHT